MQSIAQRSMAMGITMVITSFGLVFGTVGEESHTDGAGTDAVCLLSARSQLGVFSQSTEPVPMADAAGDDISSSEASMELRGERQTTSSVNSTKASGLFEGGPLSFSMPKGTQALWFDVGTAGHSDYERDVQLNKGVFFIGIEPVSHYVKAVENRLRWQSPGRFLMVQRACSTESAQKLKFFVHPLEECNSVHETNEGSIQVHGGTCVGIPPTETVVESVTLAELILQVPSHIPIPLLKVDVQGHEWPCLKGADEHLKRIDNIFLEVQDLPHEKLMYKDSLNLGDMDNQLGSMGFVRQYCEENTPWVREFNCLYTQSNRQPMWITGRPQPEGSRSVKMDMQVEPSFSGVSYVSSLETTKEPGALDGHLQSLGLL